MNNELQQPGGVVVGVDGSEQGYAATRYGAVEAHRLRTSLDLVHVLPAAIPVVPEHVPVVSEASLQAYAHQILDRARAAALETRPDLEIETYLRSGNRTRELLAATGRAVMVVLGNSSPRTFDRIWTGGTVTGVAGAATCPVAVVPAEWQPDVVHGRIAVGVKTSGDVHELYDATFAMAEELGADLVVLHAWRLEGVYDDIIADRTGAERWQQSQTALIERDLVDLRERFPGVPIRVYVRHEDPAHALVRVTRGVDRLLLQRPTSGRPHHDLGRVGRAVLRDSRCPVVVVPDHRPEHGGAHALTTNDPVEALVP
jgi:nucleotide-binding universal stress UspA family protein